MGQRQWVVRRGQIIRAKGREEFKFYSKCDGNNWRVLGNSLAVQWLGLGTFTAGAQVQSLVRELRFHKLCSLKKKKKIGGFLRAGDMIYFSKVPSDCYGECGPCGQEERQGRRHGVTTMWCRR